MDMRRQDAFQGLALPADGPKNPNRPVDPIAKAQFTVQDLQEIVAAIRQTSQDVANLPSGKDFGDLRVQMQKLITQSENDRDSLRRLERERGKHDDRILTIERTCLVELGNIATKSNQNGLDLQMANAGIASLNASRTRATAIVAVLILVGQVAGWFLSRAL